MFLIQETPHLALVLAILCLRYGFCSHFLVRLGPLIVIHAEVGFFASENVDLNGSVCIGVDSV